jgi:hypothetical protein
MVVDLASVMSKVNLDLALASAGATNPSPMETEESLIIPTPITQVTYSSWVDEVEAADLQALDELVESTPKVELSSKVESASKVETAPKAESASKAESSSKVESAPKAESTS